MSWGSRKRPRKYRQGLPITSLSERVAAAMGDDFLWWNGKPYHPQVVRQWSLAMIAGVSLYYAELTPEWIRQELEKAE